MTQLRVNIRRPHTTQPTARSPRRVGNAYHYPFDTRTGRGYVAGIIELGGGFKQTEVDKYFTDNNLPIPAFVAVPVAGGSNKPDGPEGADGEVQLDMIVLGAIAPAATIRVYFAPNTNDGFLAAVKQARADGCHGISISWGAPENSWDNASLTAFAAEVSALRAAGVPVFVAAGDTGADDGTGKPIVDFPASAPDAIGCGGTRLVLTASGERASETVWNDNPTQSATGGGVSKHFPGRDVPDIAGNADPDTGYEVMVDGQGTVIGGTSAVAPLMLGLHALLWEANGGKPFDFMDLVTTNPTAMFDVTAGSNGKFRAGPGRDETTGFGVPDGAKLLAALDIPSTAPPAAPPAADPLTDFPVAAVKAWIDHAHQHTKVEATAANALAVWAAEHGIAV